MLFLLAGQFPSRAGMYIHGHCIVHGGKFHKCHSKALYWPVLQGCYYLSIM